MPKDEFSLGSTRIHASDTNEARASVMLFPAMTLTATTIVGLRPDELRQIGEEAARSVDLPFVEVTINVEPDASDRLAYFFIYVIAETAKVTGDARLRLSRALRDRLLLAGDTTPSYIRLLSP